MTPVAARVRPFGLDWKARIAPCMIRLDWPPQKLVRMDG